MTPVRTLERLVHAPPFGLSFHDALRTALRRPDRVAPRDVTLEVTARVDENGEEPLAEPLRPVRRVGAARDLVPVDGEVYTPTRQLRRRLAPADYRLSVSHPAFEPASVVLALPVRPPLKEAPGTAPPANGDAYAARLAERRREVSLRPGPGYPLPRADAAANRTLLVVAGRFAEPFAGTVRLTRPTTSEPGGLANREAVPVRGFVLWTALPGDPVLPDGELELTLKPGGGAARTATYTVDLSVDDPGARATLARPRRPRGQVQPPSLTLLML